MARRDSDMAPDNAVAAHEVKLPREKVHRTAESLAATTGLAEEFRHHGAGAHAAGERMPVLAVGADHIVLFFEVFDRTDGDWFLTNIKMAEPADFSYGVCLGAGLLKPADEEHFFIHAQEAFVTGLHFYLGQRNAELCSVSNGLWLGG